MIATQYINSLAAEPVAHLDYLPINVLSWHNMWKGLCPYYLKTDGHETNKNDGGILFENFYQGTKVYDKVYSIDVYPNKHLRRNPKYLSWQFVSLNDGGDRLINKNGELNRDLYFRWRNSLWNCPKPVRYPNGYANRANVKFALVIDKNNIDQRMDYLTVRKEVYVKEYIRLAKQTPEYNELLASLQRGTNLMICEIDVPATHKRGNYSQSDENNISVMSLEFLERLLNDPSEAFGHGLCLAYALLHDLENN